MAAQQAGAGRDRFPTTRLSVVLAAADTEGAQSPDALDALCRLYWYPLYVFIRRQGYDVEEAKDLTQGFIARLLEKHTLRDFRRERGRFRSFLLTCVKHFLANERAGACAQKRGDGVPAVSLDLAFQPLEDRFRLEPRSDLTPDKIFERQWALEVLQRAMAGLRDEFVKSGRGDQFERLKAYLTGDGDATSYRELGRELAISEGAVKVAIHRLRRRFHHALREEISLTVIHTDEISDEIRHLIAAIRG